MDTAMSTEATASSPKPDEELALRAVVRRLVQQMDGAGFGGKKNELAQRDHGVCGPGRTMNPWWVKSESTPQASLIPSFFMSTKLRQSTKL